MSYEKLIKNIGRIKIKTQYLPTGDIKKDDDVIVEMLKETYKIHKKNVSDMEILKKFYDNYQTIEKHKEMRTDIDNYVEVPDVFRITRDLNGHICGSGVKFSDRSGEKEKQILSFNKYMENTSFDATYLKANKNASLYGVGYYYLEPNNEFLDIESPFVIESENLDPKITYCVYSQDIIPKKVWAVWVNKIKEVGKYTEKLVFNVWCEYAQYTVECQNSKYKVINHYPLVSNSIPIIEVQRNEDRIGDSELALSAIKAKNMLFSNRIDDVQQVVDYVYVLYNLTTGENEDGSKKGINDILKSRVIELEVVSPTVQPKIDIIKNPLNQSEIQTLADYLDEIINIIVALPDRNSDSTGTSDTGIANDYKLGFRNLESYSDTVTVYIKKSLKQIINIILRIVENTSYKNELSNLSINDIEIKPQRNKIFSITDTANAYSTLRNAGFNDEDAIKITNASQDIAETAKKNRLEKEQAQKDAIAFANLQKEQNQEGDLEKTNE